jgi:hypothetical protein
MVRSLDSERSHSSLQCTDGDLESDPGELELLTGGLDDRLLLAGVTRDFVHELEREEGFSVPLGWQLRPRSIKYCTEITDTILPSIPRIQPLRIGKFTTKFLGTLQGILAARSNSRGEQSWNEHHNMPSSDHYCHISAIGATIPNNANYDISAPARTASTFSENHRSSVVFPNEI